MFVHHDSIAGTFPGLDDCASGCLSDRLSGYPPAAGDGTGRGARAGEEEDVVPAPGMGTTTEDKRID
jgi:hypothetical protein